MKTTMICEKTELFCYCPYCDAYCDEMTNNGFYDIFEHGTRLVCHTCKKSFILNKKVSQ